ncbi:MAG: hypothetical protein WDO15_27145 [Bacteroidota bacterium]
MKPGDVICVNSGSTGTIQFSNIKGSATNPVTIKNCGGQVSIGGTSAQNGFLFFSSRYVHLTGAGAAGVNYGFKVTATASGSQGVAYVGLSSDIEVDHMEIANTGYSGMMIKTDPSSNCADVSAVRPELHTLQRKHSRQLHSQHGRRGNISRRQFLWRYNSFLWTNAILSRGARREDLQQPFREYGARIYPDWCWC